MNPDDSILHPCGCFFYAPYNETWKCSLHRGLSEDQQKDAEQQVFDEGIAMNGWIGTDGQSGS